jgi:hypothetical protein
LAWELALITLGTTASLACRAVLRLRVRRSYLTGGLPVGAALALHWFGLQRYAHHYGNLHTFLLMGVALLSALGIGLLGVTPRTRAWFGRAAVCALATSMLWTTLLGGTPSYSVRRAVLVWGAVAKRAVLSAAWPLFDHDGDGSPSRFWGMDPDDQRADVTPRTGLPPWPPNTVADLGVSFAPGPRRNLLWITVDAARRDSFDTALAADPALRQAFATFADHRRYTSCSSRTTEATGQLFGASRCDPRTLAGLTGRGLLELLRKSGYHDHLLSVPALPITFQQSEIIPDDDRLLARAEELLAASAGGQALFLHLRGGHGDYRGPGATARERYEYQLRASLTGVARLLGKVPADRWAVVVLGDHGEAFGEHMSFTHATTLYEEALRTPLLVRAPNVPPGPRDELVGCETVTWMTLHALGIIDREPAALPGQYAALDIDPAELGHLRGDRLRSLRVGARKVIWNSDLGIWELYDLDNDPGELRSLAESRPAELAPLRAELERLSRECPPPRVTGRAIPD